MEKKISDIMELIKNNIVISNSNSSNSNIFDHTPAASFMETKKYDQKYGHH